MLQLPLEVYRIDMKYIRNLHDKIDFKKIVHNGSLSKIYFWRKICG